MVPESFGTHCFFKHWFEYSSIHSNANCERSAFARDAEHVPCPMSPGPCPCCAFSLRCPPFHLICQVETSFLWNVALTSPSLWSVSWTSSWTHQAQMDLPTSEIPTSRCFQHLFPAPWCFLKHRSPWRTSNYLRRQHCMVMKTFWLLI